MSVSRAPLYQQLTVTLRRELQRHGQPGTRFGTETALAKRFAVSIVTLREAVLVLMQEGMLERRHGSGLYTCSSPMPSPRSTTCTCACLSTWWW